MKKYFILLLAVTTIFAKKDAEIVIPDNISISDDKKEIKGIYKVDLTSDEIYAKTLLWLALNINDSRVSIEYKDKENHKIVGSIILTRIPIKKDLARNSEINYLIEIKDGRYRIQFTKFKMINDEGMFLRQAFFSNKGYEKYYNNRCWNGVFSKTMETFSDLHNYLNIQSEKTDDDW